MTYEEAHKSSINALYDVLHYMDELDAQLREKKLNRKAIQGIRNGIVSVVKAQTI